MRFVCIFTLLTSPLQSLPLPEVWLSLPSWPPVSCLNCARDGLLWLRVSRLRCCGRCLETGDRDGVAMQAARGDGICGRCRWHDFGWTALHTSSFLAMSAPCCASWNSAVAESVEPRCAQLRSTLNARDATEIPHHPSNQTMLHRLEYASQLPLVRLAKADFMAVVICIGEAFRLSIICITPHLFLQTTQAVSPGNHGFSRAPSHVIGGGSAIEIASGQRPKCFEQLSRAVQCSLHQSKLLSHSFSIIETLPR